MRKNIQTILVPIDFKEPSRRAVQYAGNIAEKTDAALIFLYVIDTPGLLAQFFQSNDQLVEITSQAKDKLSEVTSDLMREKPQLNISSQVVLGKPYQKILDVAKEENAQLIILGENHESGHPDETLGTTIYQVTLNAPVPVLTYTGDTSKMNDRIVVPLDLTKEIREKLSAALFYGLEYGATIFLVSALIGGIEIKESRIWKKLQDAKETLELNGVKCEIKLFERSKVPPYQRVLEYTKEIDAGMILLMTHREGNTSINYIGAFAHYIMNKSQVPVLSISSVKARIDIAGYLNAMVDPMGVIIGKSKSKQKKKPEIDAAVNHCTIDLYIWCFSDTW